MPSFVDRMNEARCEGSCFGVQKKVVCACMSNIRMC